MLQAWLPDNALQYCKTCEAEEVHQWTVNYLKEYYNIDASNIESSNTVFKIAEKDREYLIVVVESETQVMPPPQPTPAPPKPRLVPA